MLSFWSPKRVTADNSNNSGFGWSCCSTSQDVVSPVQKIIIQAPPQVQLKEPSAPLVTQNSIETNKEVGPESDEMFSGGLAFFQRLRKPSAASEPAAFRVIFAYGSQMGASEEIARNLHAEAVQKLDLKSAEICSLNELKLDSIFPPTASADGKPYMFLVVVSSSTGDGDAPDNAASFFAALRRKYEEVSGKPSKSKPFKGLYFTVAGLGDSSFTRFMHVPCTIRTRLHEMGAEAFFPAVEADDAKGTDEAISKWQVGMLPALGGAVTAAKEMREVPTTSPLPLPLNKAEDKGSDERSKIDTNKAAEEPASLVQAISLDASKATPTAAPPPPPALAPATPSAGPSGFPLVSADVEVSGVPALMPLKTRLVFVEDESQVAAARAAEATSSSTSSSSSSSSSFTSAGPVYVPSRISDVECFTAPWSDRRVIHVEFEIQSSHVDLPAAQYLPGDAVSILPENDTEEVEALLARLGVDGDRVFNTEPLDAAAAAAGRGVLPHLPRPCSVRGAFTRYVDITGSAQRKSLLRTLAEHCTEAAEKRTLLLLCSASKEGRDAFAREIQKPGPTLAQILERFPSCRPPLDALFDALPALAPRMYSLTCSPLACKGRVQVALSVVSFKSQYGSRKGVASCWLDRLTRPALEATAAAVSSADAASAAKAEALAKLPAISIAVRKGGDFRVPNDLSVPIIMIGPGTGVAPFRGFLQHRRALAGAHSSAAAAVGSGSDVAVGASWLFFGCRREDEDYLYKDDLAQLSVDGTLTKLRVAFSRRPDAPKVYVQNLVAEEGAELARLVTDANAHVFICGDGAHMAKDVHAALVEMLVAHRGMSAEVANGYLNTMLQEHRYVKDVWS